MVSLACGLPHASSHQADGAFAGGSKFGDPHLAGASAILQDGRVAVFHLLGPNSYKAELIGMLLRSHFWPDYEQLHLDCEGATYNAQVPLGRHVSPPEDVLGAWPGG